MGVSYQMGMGILERKEREKVEMRRLILEAARTLFLENGYEKVSIRNIADAIEYSPATIYLYYRDKNELLFALRQEAFGKLIEEFQSIYQIEQPFDRLVEMGHKYLQFAFQSPELFDLMFIMTAPMEALSYQEDWSGGKLIFNLLVKVMQRCIDAGAVRHQDAETAAMMVWSSVHGLAALFLRKRMTVIEEDRWAEVINKAYELFTETVRKGL